MKFTKKVNSHTVANEIIHTEKLKWYRKDFASSTTGLCVYEDLLLVCGEDPHSLLVLSRNDGTSVQGVLEFPKNWSWTGDLIGITFSHAKDKMFVNYRSSNKIVMFSVKKDPISQVTSLELLSEIKGEAPWALACLGGDVIITSSEKEDALILYTTTMKIVEIGRIKIATKATGIAVDKNHNIYYTTRSNNCLNFIKKKPNQLPSDDPRSFGPDQYENSVIIAGGGATNITRREQSLTGNQVRFNTVHSVCITPQEDIFICQSFGTTTSAESFLFRIRKNRYIESKELSNTYVVSPVYMHEHEKTSGLGLCLDSRNNIYFSTYNSRSVGRVDLYNISDQLLLFYSGFFDTHSTIRSLLKEIIFIIANFSVFIT